MVWLGRGVVLGQPGCVGGQFFLIPGAARRRRAACLVRALGQHILEVRAISLVRASLRTLTLAHGFGDGQVELRAQLAVADGVARCRDTPGRGVAGWSSTLPASPRSRRRANVAGQRAREGRRWSLMIGTVSSGRFLALVVDHEQTAGRLPSAVPAALDVPRDADAYICGPATLIAGVSAPLAGPGGGPHPRAPRALRPRPPPNPPHPPPARPAAAPPPGAARRR